MAKTDYINARVESALKKKAERVLRHVGVKTSDAVTMFLQQVVLYEGLPFEVRRPNTGTRRAIRALEAGKGTIYKGDTKKIFNAVVKER